MHWVFVKLPSPWSYTIIQYLELYIRISRTQSIPNLVRTLLVALHDYKTWLRKPLVRARCFSSRGLPSRWRLGGGAPVYSSQAVKTNQTHSACAPPPDNDSRYPPFRLSKEVHLNACLYQSHPSRRCLPFLDTSVLITTKYSSRTGFM